jgi:hypothetical protein
MMHNIIYEELIKRAYNTKKHGVATADAALFERVLINEYAFLQNITDKKLKATYTKGFKKLKKDLVNALSHFLKENQNLDNRTVDRLLDNLSNLRESDNMEKLSEAVVATKSTFDEIDNL